MRIDLQKIRPVELVRLLNSTPMGEVMKPYQLSRHRSQAGYRIGDGKSVDLYRYAAWLRNEVMVKREIEAAGVDPYQAVKDRAQKRQREIALSSRDIGELPAVVDPERKAKAATDFRFFCESYFPEVFDLPWSKDHPRVIAKIEGAIMRGGLFALAMPRASGKSVLTECAAMWSLLYGHRSFVCLIGSDEGAASEMLESIKTSLECGDLLLEDFPEACYPIRKLEGIYQRRLIYQGKPIRMEFTAKQIVLPNISESKASGAVVNVTGITGRIRGMKYKRSDGSVTRPSLVIVDDPQTDESARSPAQCAVRENILAGAVLGLGGPGKKIAGIMPCTVIRPGDLADRLLDRDLHPQWQGERTKLVYSFPANMKLWEEYAEVLNVSLKADGGIKDATDFYRERQAEMDFGAEVSWPERYEHDELSGIQYAMNIFFLKREAFFAEYQNEPLPDRVDEEATLSAEQIMSKLNRMPRGTIPVGVTHLTAFIDVQGELLYWLVCGWTDDFSGFVVDYGAYPDQQRAYFQLREANPTLAKAAAGTGLEGSIYAGLEKLTGQLLGKEWARDGGSVLRIERCLIDANWGTSTDVVYQFCRQSAHAALLLPSHGQFFGASSVPMADHKKKPGERIGHNWRIPNVMGKRAVRHVLYDTNYWKSFIHARLAVAMGDRGCLSLFGDDPHRHRMLAEHLVAEYRVRTTGRGREIDEWKLRPERPDNHLLDCLVGCAVAASMQGVSLLESSNAAASNRQTIKLSDIQRQKRNAR